MKKADVVRYLCTMSLIGLLFEKQVIGWEDFLAFENKIRRKYGLKKNSIYRDHSLLIVPVRGNIAHCEEVIPCKRK